MIAEGPDFVIIVLHTASQTCAYFIQHKLILFTTTSSPALGPLCSAESDLRLGIMDLSQLTGHCYDFINHNMNCLHPEFLTHI